MGKKKQKQTFHIKKGKTKGGGGGGGGGGGAAPTPAKIEELLAGEDEELSPAAFVQAYDLGRDRTGPRNFMSLLSKEKVTAKLKALEEENPGEGCGTGEGRVGLRNLQNTCYMNSVLQCLHAEGAFTKALLGLRTEDEASRACQMVFAALTGGGGGYADPSGVVRALGIDASEQQDALEFLRLVVDYISANGDEHWDQAVKQLFDSGVFHCTRCLHCGNESKRFESARDFLLPLKHQAEPLKRLEDCLDVYFSSTSLKGADQYHCGECKSLRDAERKTWLAPTPLPEVLVVAPMRFEYDIQKQRRSKLSQELSFPARLDLTRWIHGGGAGHASDFELCAIVEHHGTAADKGHYTARVLRGEEWVLCDDRKVTSTTLDTKEGRVKSADASVLFYRRRPSPPVPEDLVRPHLEAYREAQSVLLAEYTQRVETVRPRLEAVRDSIRDCSTAQFKALPSDWVFVTSEWLKVWGHGDLAQGGQPGAARDPHAMESWVEFLCPHSSPEHMLVDPHKTSGFKVVPAALAQIAASSVDSSSKPLVVSRHVCAECVRTKLRSLADVGRAERQRKTMLGLGQRKIKAEEPAAWVSAAWFREWSKATPSKEKLVQWDVLEKVRCEHGELSPEREQRRLVPLQVWEYFIGDGAFHSSSPDPVLSDASECEPCTAALEKRKLNWAGQELERKRLRRELKELFDAVGRKAGAHARNDEILGRDWAGQARANRKEHEREKKQREQQRELKRERARAEEQEAAVSSVRPPDAELPALDKGRIPCIACSTAFNASDWPKHRTSKRHNGNCESLDKTPAEIADESELMEKRRRWLESPDGVAAVERLAQASPAKEASVSPEKQKEAAKGEEEEEEEEEEDEEEEEEEDPDHFLDDVYHMVPWRWAEEMHGWLQTGNEDVPPRPSPARTEDVLCSCETGGLGFRLEDWMPLKGKKAKVGRTRPSEPPFLLVSEELLETLGKEGLYASDNVPAQVHFRDLPPPPDSP
eukprot:Hpha_TRINITY_DN15916_c4_g5::TRINITY_DN15916_c4_g5_i2::g.72761::m.72761/K11858/USP48; ubiquitin carboxyl-terminal hydrolase 48